MVYIERYQLGLETKEILFPIPRCTHSILDCNILLSLPKVMPPQIKEPQEAGKHSHQTRSSLLNKHFLPCDQITTF
jgi:hypothetical protein